jgi:hypothetical protein
MNKKQNTGKLPMSGGMKRCFHAFSVAVITVTLLFAFSATAHATGTGGAVPSTADPIAVVSNLSDFIFSLIRAIGLIMLGFGIVQVGMSLKSHDPSQRANGFLTLCGGVVIAFTREILTLITGG